MIRFVQHARSLGWSESLIRVVLGAGVGAVVGFLPMAVWIVGYDARYYGIGSLIAIAFLYGGAAAVAGGTLGIVVGLAISGALALGRRMARR